MLAKVQLPTAAHRPRSAVRIGLLSLGVLSVFLSLVGQEKMHLHVVWQQKTLDKVKEFASVSLPQPLIKPTLQLGSYTQEAVSRSMERANSQGTTHPNRGVCMSLYVCVCVCVCV